MNVSIVTETLPQAANWSEQNLMKLEVPAGGRSGITKYDIPLLVVTDRALPFEPNQMASLKSRDKLLKCYDFTNASLRLPSVCGLRFGTGR